MYDGFKEIQTYDITGYMKGERAAKGLIAKRLHHPNKARQSRVYADDLLLHQYYVKTTGRLLRTPVSAVLRAALCFRVKGKRLNFEVGNLNERQACDIEQTKALLFTPTAGV